MEQSRQTHLHLYPRFSHYTPPISTFAGDDAFNSASDLDRVASLTAPDDECSPSPRSSAQLRIGAFLTSLD